MSKIMVVLATLGVVAFLAFAVSTRAATAETIPAREASVGRETAAGVQSGRASATMAALHRIWRAARTACGERPGPMELDDYVQYRKCMSEEVRGGLAALSDPRRLASDAADCKVDASVASR